MCQDGESLMFPDKPAGALNPCVPTIFMPDETDTPLVTPDNPPASQTGNQPNGWINILDSVIDIVPGVILATQGQSNQQAPIINQYQQSPTTPQKESNNNTIWIVAGVLTVVVIGVVLAYRTKKSK